MKTGFGIIFLLCMMLACQPQEEQVKRRVIAAKEPSICSGENELSPIVSVADLGEYEKHIDSLKIRYQLPSLLDTTAFTRGQDSTRLAFQLGMGWADFFHAYVFNEEKKCMDYLAREQVLLARLDVDRFFNFDSLRYLVAHRRVEQDIAKFSVGANSAAQFLRVHQKSKLVIMAAIGFLTEQTYLICQAYKKRPDSLLYNKIGLQRELVSQVYLGAQEFAPKNHRDTSVQLLFDHLRQLDNIYDNIGIKYDVGRSRLIEKDGELIIESTEKCVVDIPPVQTKRITEIVTCMRKSFMGASLSINSHH